jgi:membrane protease YdiL (CAAX protease family)
MNEQWVVGPPARQVPPTGAKGPDPDPARPMRASQALLEMAVLLGLYLLAHILLDLALALTTLVVSATPSWNTWIASSPFFVHFFRGLILGASRGLDFVVLTAVFLGSWITAFVYGRWRRNMSFAACFGLFILIFHFARQFYLFLPELQTVADTGSVASAVPAEAFYRTVVAKSFREVFLPAAALLLLYGGFPGLQARADQVRRRAKGIAARFRLGIRKSPLIDTMHGLWTFFLVLIGAVIVNYYATRYASTGDESQVFSQVTPDLVIWISLAAGVGEEFVFRGILLGFLLLAFRVDRTGGAARVLLTSLAIFLQAAFFGLVHAGYGSLAHIITPFAFGIIVGVVFLRFGFLPAVLVHFLIDVAALGAPLVRGNFWADLAFSAFLLSTLVVPAIFFLYRGLEWLDEKGRLMGRLVVS